MPAGIKIILTVFYISAFAQFISMIIRPNRTAVIAGFTIQSSASLLFYIALFIISIALIIAIHRRSGRKSLLIFLGFYALILLINSVIELTAPLSEIAQKLNIPLDLSEQAIIQAKIIYSAISGFFFILLLLAFIYLFKNRQYFSSSKK